MDYSSPDSDDPVYAEGIQPTQAPPILQSAIDAAPALSPVRRPPTPTSGGAKTKRKKVRFACERCRYRRVKCDGQVPACGNCSKANAQCIDVDSRNMEKRLVRGSLEQAAGRISWLEDIIRTHLPHVDLSDNLSAYTHAEHFEETSENTIRSLDVSLQDSSFNHIGRVQGAAGSGKESLVTDSHPYPARGTKRPSSAVNSGSTFRENSVDQEARSVALELGLLSLNPGSRQTHYLGTSSGSLFAPLFLTKTSRRDITTDQQSSAQSKDGYTRKETPEFKSGTPASSPAPDIQKAIEALSEQLRKCLPNRDECNVLCDQYFSHMHPNHPFLHRPSFNYAVDALYQCMNEATTNPCQHNGWPPSIKAFPYNGEESMSQCQKLVPISVHVAAFQLFIVLSIGATLQIRGRTYGHNPKKFFAAAMSLSNYVFGCISLPVLQSVLLIIVYSLIDPDGFDVYTLTHIAMAHAVDLGIHRDVSSLGIYSPIALDMRRRVFFSVYSLDRSISTIQGRPLGLGDDTFDTNLPKMSDAQIQLVKSNISSDEFDDICTLSYSIQTFKMARLVSRIKSGFYRLQVHTHASVFSQDHSSAQYQFCTELSQWLEESTTVVSETVPEDQRLRLTTKLQIQYHGAMCLLHQPSQAITNPSDDALKICYSSATQRLHLFEILYDSGSLCHSWRTVQDMFLAGATIMFCVSISPAIRRSVSISTLSRDFRACSNMLSVGGEWWPTIRKAKYSLERLSNNMLEILAENVPSSEPELRVRQQPFLQEYIPNMMNWPGPDVVGHGRIDETLLSVLNYDGRLIDFFDDSLTDVLMEGMPAMSQSNSEFDAAFWDGFNQGVP